METNLWVDCYAKEIKYTGNYSDHTTDDFINQAKSEIDDMQEYFKYSFNVSRTTAKQLNGKFIVCNTHPDKNICEVRWYYINRHK